MGSWKHYWHRSTDNWHYTAPSSRPTITVTDEADDDRKARDEKVKQGARVVPFGFGRVLTDDAPPVAEQFISWEDIGA